MEKNKEEKAEEKPIFKYDAVWFHGIPIQLAYDINNNNLIAMGIWDKYMYSQLNGFDEL